MGICIKELSIGNLVCYNGKVVKVEQITKRKIGYHTKPYEMGMNYAGLCEIGPIPITEELLEKCGFERNNDMPPYILDLDKGRHVYMFKNTYGWILQYVRYGVGYDETVSKNIVMFVHQLQNAYYLATGKELEIKI